MTITVYAKKIQQWAGAPVMYVADLPPSKLLSWASVPRKSPLGMEGYQRPLDDRYKQIAKFMEKHVSNIIPGTIIVAVEKGAPYIKIEPVVINSGGKVDIQLHNFFKLTIDYSPPVGDLDKLNEIIASFESRMSPEELSTAAAFISDTAIQPEEPIDKNGSEEKVHSRVANFVGTLKKLSQNWATEIESKPEDDKTRMDWISWIKDKHKIGFILDGQHRVWGAEQVNPLNAKHLKDDQEPILSVTIIPELKIAEQVFHFSMMNITPVRVKAGHARGNATFSLTNQEFEDYKPRLGEFIDTSDTEWINAMDSDLTSPFRGKLTWDYLPGAPANFLKESIANSIQKSWRKPDKSHKIFGKLFEDAENWFKTDDFKKDLFFKFWERISIKFSNDWSKADSNLWYKVSLMTLQDFIREKMAQQVKLWKKSNKSPFDELVSMGNFVDHILDSFPSDFYSRPWNYTPDDTDQGKSELTAIMESQYGQEKIDARNGLWRGAGV